MPTTTAEVELQNLHVVITHEDGTWFAQSAEIDYAAQGETLKDVKKRFEEGLSATIDEHLRVYGTIEKLLVPAPPEVWKELVEAADAKDGKYEFSQITTHHGVPTQIRYAVLEKAA